MKRKWLVPVIVLGVLALILILVWPMAPVWQKLGLEPVRIQGSWPELKLVPCSGQEQAVQHQETSLLLAANVGIEFGLVVGHVDRFLGRRRRARFLSGSTLAREA